MSLLADFNTVTTSVLTSLNAAFPAPMDLDPRAIATASLGSASRAGDVGNMIAWLVVNGYLNTRDARLDPTFFHGASLTVLGFGVTGLSLPSSLTPHA